MTKAEAPKRRSACSPRRAQSYQRLAECEADAAAQEMGIDVSHACEEGLRAELTRRWQEDNAEAIAAHNA